MSPEQLRATIEQTRNALPNASAIDRPWIINQLHDLIAVSRDTQPMPAAPDDEPAGYLITRDGREIELDHGQAHVTDDSR